MHMCECVWKGGREREFHIFMVNKIGGSSDGVTESNAKPTLLLIQMRPKAQDCQIPSQNLCRTFLSSFFLGPVLSFILYTIRFLNNGKDVGIMVTGGRLNFLVSS